MPATSIGYQRRGFQARVKWRWRNRSGDPVEVEFLIHEARSSKVRDIEFAPGPSGKPLMSYGVEQAGRTGGRRYPQLNIWGARRFPDVGSGAFPDVAHLENSIVEGYPKARFGAHGALAESLGKFALLGLQTALDEDGQSGDLFLRFEIDEARGKRVDSVAVGFVGDRTVSKAQIVKGLLLRAGKPYARCADR